MKFVECDLCKSIGYTLVFESMDYITNTPQKVVRCQQCGLVYVNPQPDADELGDHYPRVYYGEEPFLYEKLDAYSRFKRIRNFVTKGSTVLDIGCGRGLVLSRLKEIGCEVRGTELSDTSSKYAKNVLQLNIINRDLKDCGFNSDYFDVITMFHSLEHMISPLATLKEVYRILRPGGTLLVEVPDFGSIYSKIFKEKWFHLDVPRHLFHFTAHTLEKSLLTAGFSVFKQTRYAIMYDSFGALQSLLNYICLKSNLLNDFNTKRIKLKDNLSWSHKRVLLDIIISLLFQTIFYIPLFVFSYFLSIFNVGGTLVLYARKL